MEPLVLESSIEVPFAPGAVWSVLADVPRWPLWCPPVRRVVHFEGLEAGARLAYVLAMGPGIPVSFDVRIERVQAPEQLRWSSTKWWGVTGTRSFGLEETEVGTRITDRKVFESRLWPVARMYPRSLVRSMSDGWLEGLASEVARRAEDDVGTLPEDEGPEPTSLG